MTLDTATWWQVGLAGAGFAAVGLYFAYFRHRRLQRAVNSTNAALSLSLATVVAVFTVRVWLIMPLLPQTRLPSLQSLFVGPPMTPAGLVAGLVGLAVAIGAAYVLARYLRENLSVTHQDYAAPSALLTTGIYDRVRHPGAVVNFLLTAGIALATGAAITLALLPAFALILHLTCIVEEREVLRPRFGAAYDAYAARVPRYAVREGLAGLSAIVIATGVLATGVLAAQ